MEERIPAHHRYATAIIDTLTGLQIGCNEQGRYMAYKWDAEAKDFVPMLPGGGFYTQREAIMTAVESALRNAIRPDDDHTPEENMERAAAELKRREARVIEHMSRSAVKWIADHLETSEQ